MNQLNAIKRPTPIDYAKIAQAVEFYRLRGFEYIDVPWAVQEDAMNVTKPANATNFPLEAFTDLVASGEQSFIEMMFKDELPKGRYVCVTPCFRNETDRTDWTRLYFMKVELIDSFDTSEGNLERIVNIAQDFFKQYLSRVDVVKTDIGFDIQSCGLELGSYGIRSYHDYKWIYATGCAEPRLSIAENYLKKA